jgi:hypothetical protein
VDDWCKKTWSSDLFTGPVSLDISNGGEMYPTAFRVQGYTARTFSELKTKLEQFPSGTTFRWCPQASNPFDAFTPGQRKEMFEDLSIFLSKHSMIVEPYSTEKCPQ